VDYYPPGLEWAFYDAAAAASWVVNATAARNVSPLEHNSCIVRLGTLMDAIAKPERPQFAVAGGDLMRTPYAVARYYGPAAGSNDTERPVVGAFPAPAAGEALTWWHALARYVQRLASLTRVPGTVPTTAVPGVLVGVCGPLPPSMVRMPTGAMPQFWIREDPGTAAVAGPLFAGAVAFAGRRAAAARTPGGTSPPAPVLTPATVDETTVLPVVTRLAAEYETQSKKGATRALVSIGGGVMASYIYAKVAGRKR
jgi:hypothetical protein